MTTIKDRTYTAECDRCGRKLVLASGYNALALDSDPEKATEIAARSGWCVEANGDVECDECAIADHRAEKAAEIDDDEACGGEHGVP